MWQFFILSFTIIHLINCASIGNKEEDVNKLELIKEDMLQVGNSVNQFVFDILNDILDTTTEENLEEIEDNLKNNTIIKAGREKRDTSQTVAAAPITVSIPKIYGNKELETLCKHLNHSRNCSLPINKINQIKDHVKKLETLLDILNDQQIDIKNKTNNYTINENLNEKDLNETKHLLILEHIKSELLEKELNKQKGELLKLEETFKRIAGDNQTILKQSDSISRNNFTERIRSNQNNNNNNHHNSKINELKQLLSDINDDDNSDNTGVDSVEIRRKILDLEKRLKKRRNDKLIKEIRQIEEQLQPPHQQSDDVNVKSLQDLEEAINRLRPKEDNVDHQFQTIFNKLIPRPIVNTPREQDKITNYKRSGTNFIPYVCVIDNGRNQEVQQFYGPPPSQQLTPPSIQTNYHQIPPYEDTTNYQNNQYRTALRNQIDDLQVAVSNLNKPDNQNNKAILTNLEMQINELRSMINQTHYRNKRSTNDTRVDDDHRRIVDDIQNRIDKIKIELENQQQPQQRSAATSPTPVYNPGDFIQDFFYNFDKQTELKSSTYGKQNDIFTEIIAKIIDKILAAIPVIVRKLFNFSIEELTNYDNYNPQNYEIIELFRNLGIFGYLPVILIRILSGFGNFMNLLRYNKVFRTLILPIMVLGTVAGSVLFLIWFLQPDDTQQYISYDNYSNNNNYIAPTSYSKSYTN